MSKKIAPIVTPGMNCWRIERAGKASVVIDAARYYHLIRNTMEKARRQILIIGWDFDTRIALEPNEEGRGESLGQFFLRLAKKRPKRTIDILKWSFGAKKQLLHPGAAWMLLRWQRTKSIDFRFDASHPPGCSHHQKIVVIDDHLAICGGIDMSKARWDTSEHLDDDPRRRMPNGKLYPPWHDVTMMMSGDIAKALGDLGHDRWRVATREDLPAIKREKEDLWPDDLAIDFQDVDIAIARTRAEYEQVEEVREIEALYLDMIAAAERFIYIENQYLTSGKICAAIATRMKEENPPDIVAVMPRTADGWLEQKAMDGARAKLVEEIGKVDKNKRFRVYVPVTKRGEDIYVHAKVAIVDDRFLRVGSSNMNNRSLGLDSECDVIIDTALPQNKGREDAIATVRNTLIAEHLDVTPEAFAAAFERAGSLVDAIEGLRSEGKTLELLTLEDLSADEEFIAENELLDPESADDFLEPIHKRSLWKSWGKGVAILGRRNKRG